MVRVSQVVKVQDSSGGGRLGRREASVRKGDWDMQAVRGEWQAARPVGVVALSSVQDAVQGTVGRLRSCLRGAEIQTGSESTCHGI